jgi:tetratricopeptide (TPR) repeat protein
MKKYNTTPDNSSQTSRESTRYSYISWIALIIATLYFLPTLGIVSKTSLWAFAVNTYWPTGLIILHLILITVTCVFLFRPRLLSFTLKISKKHYYILFACAMILMAIFLREKVPFYGDGYFFQKDIITNLPIKYAEVLTMLIYRGVYIILPASSRTGALAYQIINTACVIPAVFILLSFTRRITQEYLPFAVFAFLGFGANVLFFGHVENYTLVYVAMLLYLCMITKQHPNIALSAFLLGISICLHLVALCLIPSFLYILWKERIRMPIWRFVLASTTFFLLPFVLTTFFSFVAGITPGQLYTQIAASLATLSQHTGHDYMASLLTVDHWLDIVNLLFLGLPIFPIVALFVFTRRNKVLWRDRNIQLILLLAVPFILFIVFFNTPLGLARDWDLGVTALVWRVAAIGYLAKQLAPKKHLSPLLLTSLGLLAFVLTLPWLAIHHFPQLNEKRFSDIVASRPELSGTAYGYEILGRYYHDTENYRSSAESYEEAAKYDPQNWRRYYSVAMEYLNLKESELALTNLRKSQELNPDEAMILMELGLLYRSTGKTDSALRMFKELYQQDTTDVMRFHNLGCAYYWAGQYKAAQDVFVSILNGYPDHYNATLGLIDVMLATGDLAEAERLLERLESKYGSNQLIEQYRTKLKQME